MPACNTTSATCRLISTAPCARAREEKKSLNEVAVEALLQAFALRGEGLKRRDLSDVAGSWIEDPEVDLVLEEQRNRHYDALPQLERV